MEDGVKPQIEAKELVMDSSELDPTFQGGSSHTARATLTNPTTSEFTYVTKLYLGISVVAEVSGSVTIPAGQSATVTFPMVMPIAEGEYGVFLDVWVGTELLMHYQATENVIIEVTPAIDIDFIGWE